MKRTSILGINAYHGDASAALVVDGELVAAVEEERFNRIKHWAGFPEASIRWCLKQGGVKAEDLDHVAISFNPWANITKRLGFVLKNRPSVGAIMDRLMRQKKTLDLHEQLANALSLDRGQLKAKIHRIEHHQTHIASSYLISPYDEAAVLSVDGMGDFASTVTAHAKDISWRVLDRVWFPHSIGFLYSAITMYLGFPYYGDEYKVMGLAPYGEPEYLGELRKMIYPKGDTFQLNLDYFTHHQKGVKMAWNEGAPVVEPFFSDTLEKLLGPRKQRGEPLTSRDENIARSLQAVTEEIVFHLLRGLHRKTKTPNLCLAGGVAMNSVANGKITRETPFENVYVPAGAADNGTSFGGAFYVWNQVLKQPRCFVQRHAYWGCESSDEECLEAIQSAGLTCLTLGEDELFEETVERIIQGKVVGWFQGRMEFGARALGSRSLVADPRRADMREIINLRIKFREKFRPFAPSILEEHVGEWFEMDEKAPYMEKVLPIRVDKRATIPAVTHVDGSGRLQTVSKLYSPRYHRLISSFYQKTGVPIILNTSLNENEPVVRLPAEAIACFLRTDMDVLVLGNHIIDRDQVRTETRSSL